MYSKFSKFEAAVILMYHSVSSESDRNWIDPDNDIPEEMFEKQMRYLHKNCKVVSMDHLCRCIRNNSPIEPRTVVITFDDGYRNNLGNAAKVLDRYQFPAIIYLATEYISRGEAQWIDELYSYFKFRTINTLELDGFGKLDLSSKESAEEAYESLKLRLREFERGNRRLLLDRIKKKLRPSPIPTRLTLSWNELSEQLTEFSNITLGVHTQNHVNLTSLGPESIDNEINLSISDVLKNLGVEVKHFSYPYGRWNDIVRSRVEQASLYSAVTTEPVPAVTINSDVLSLPRIEVPRNMALFKYMVSGAYPGLSQLVFRRPKAATTNN